MCGKIKKNIDSNLVHQNIHTFLILYLDGRSRDLILNGLLIHRKAIKFICTSQNLNVLEFSIIVIIGKMIITARVKEQIAKRFSIETDRKIIK